MQISYDDDLKCITGVVQASMRSKSYAVEVPNRAKRAWKRNQLECVLLQKAAQHSGTAGTAAYQGI
ncbi:hypothetical protein HPB47_021530 [Ixodes persulcatus]|uniref:Uncharacterized protein n=1 Tax=Ixodes persulcatus TaxID=34615 RepID=A0AC60QC94_IXOPE|nr:hypothetical protein HPB47_021530 [Ixodes persulcatus]